MTGRSTFGTELRRRRQAAGKSLNDLAQAIHYSKGHLSKIESGDKPANAMLAQLCDAALDADGALVALVAESAPNETEIDAGPDTGVWRLRLAPNGTGSFARDETATGGLAFGPSYGAGRLPSDPSLLLTLFAARFEQERSLAQLVSPAFVLPPLISQAHLLRGMAGRTPPGEAAGLWRLAAQFAEFVGWMMQELGDERETVAWTGHAVEWAHIGGDDSLRPYALFRRADATIYKDDPNGTIDLARRAQRDPAATARVRGLAAQREAQGYALLGLAAECFRALDRSAELLDEATRTPTGGPVLGTTRTPDPTAMVRGWCLVDLGRPADAAELLEPGLDYFKPGTHRARARYGLRTALAHAIAGELERPCEIVELLADDLRQIDSATARHDLRMLSTEFRRRSANPRVRELLPVLADLLRGRAS
jgi:transcriptional regulator with XRE-family HTH domain